MCKSVMSEGIGWMEARAQGSEVGKGRGKRT